MTNLPFSVPVDEDLKIAPTDLMRIQRDHFEGTPFSATEGLAGGPYGDPNRFDLSVTGELTLDEVLQGEFPRTISLFRTSYSFVAQSRRFVPNILSLLWFCQYAPDSSSYSPIYVAASELPTPFTRGTMHEYSTESAWWNACVVGNYAARFYKFAMSPVRKLQKRLEASLSAEVLAIEASIRTAISGSIGSAKELTNQLTQFTLEKGQQVSNEWRDLFPYILTHYRDGYVLDTDSPTIGIAKMFYPRWWLEAVGYFKIGPNLSPNAIMFASKDQVLSAGSFQVSLFFYIFSLVVVSLLSAVIMRYSIRKNEEKGYQRILEI